MSPNCPVLRRCLSFLRKASWGVRIWMVAAFVSLAICEAGAQINQFPLDGVGTMSIPQQSPPLVLSGVSDTVTLSWPATASDFVIESSSELDLGIWTRVTNAIIDV